MTLNRRVRRSPKRHGLLQSLSGEGFDHATGETGGAQMPIEEFAVGRGEVVQHRWLAYGLSHRCHNVMWIIMGKLTPDCAVSRIKVLVIAQSLPDNRQAHLEI